MSNRMDIPAASAGSAYGLKFHGLYGLGAEKWNLSTPDLYEAAITRGEARLSARGALLVRGDDHGHVQERLVVQDDFSADTVWWSECNQPISEARFFGLHARLAAYLQGRDVFVQDCHVGTEHRLPVRVITETACHSLAARNLFIPVKSSEGMHAFIPEFTVIHCPGFRAVPERDGTSKASVAALHIGARLGLLCGVWGAIELQDLVAALMSYLLPQEGILPLLCRVEAGRQVALFIGRDDLLAPSSAFHAWSDNGVSAIFAGSCIEFEADALDHFGCLTCLSGAPRGGWVCMPGETEPGDGRGHPSDLFLLVNDSRGALPLIARLTPAQTAYYFLCGYATRLASKGPLEDAFGRIASPVRHPGLYADMLMRKLERHGTRCWLMNTGLRQAQVCATLDELRRTVGAAMNGTLDTVPCTRNPVFGFEVPIMVPDCRDVLLNGGTEAVQRELASYLATNVRRLVWGCSREVVAAGPET